MTLWMKGLAALVIVTLLGGMIWGFWTFIESQFEAKDTEIRLLKEDVAGLRIDKQKLENSNASLDAALRRSELNFKEQAGLLYEMRLEDAKSQMRIDELENKVRNEEQAERIDAQRKGGKASLQLRLMNSQARCELENFGRTGGECRGAVWKPN